MTNNQRHPDSTEFDQEGDERKEHVSNENLTLFFLGKVDDRDEELLVMEHLLSCKECEQRMGQLVDQRRRIPLHTCYTAAVLLRIAREGMGKHINAINVLTYCPRCSRVFAEMQQSATQSLEQADFAELASKYDGDIQKYGRLSPHAHRAHRIRADAIAVSELRCELGVMWRGAQQEAHDKYCEWEDRCEEDNDN